MEKMSDDAGTLRTGEISPRGRDIGDRMLGGGDKTKDQRLDLPSSNRRLELHHGRYILGRGFEKKKHPTSNYREREEEAEAEDR